MFRQGISALAIVVAAGVGLTVTAEEAYSADSSLIDFESDTPGLVPNGFVSVDEPGIGFNFFGEAEIGDFGIASDGQALKNSFLGPSSGFGNFGTTIITLPEPNNPGLITSISFDFGNDVASLTSPGDLAVLRLFLAGELVGQVTQELNRDEALNQTIGFSGAEFARVEFAYTDAFLTPLPLEEVIDNINIEFNTPSETVPEPLSALAVLSFGAIAVSGALKKKLSA